MTPLSRPITWCNTSSASAPGSGADRIGARALPPTRTDEPVAMWRPMPGVSNCSKIGSTRAARASYDLCNVLHLVGKVATGSRRRERFAVLVVERDGFFDDLAKFRENSLLVCAVTSAVDQSRRTPDFASSPSAPDIAIGLATFG